MYSFRDIQQIKLSYQQDGVCLLKGFCVGERLKLVKDAIEFCLSKPSPFSKKIESENGVFFHDFWTNKRNKFVQKLLSDSDFINVIKKIVDTKKLNFFHDHVLVKKPSSPSTPWHQDRPYYFLEGPKTFSIWITPDDVSEDNSLAFCRKSHLSGKEYVPVDFKSDTAIGSHESLEVLNDEVLRMQTSNGVIVYRMEPGDAIIFNNKTLHRSMPSSAEKSRSALSLRFVGDETKLTTICSNPTPPFHKLGMELKDGANIDDAWFPNLPLKL